MLLELAQWLAKDVRVFNVFNYITLRAVLACLTALAVSLVLGPYMIRKLTAYKIGQAVRDDGPRSHLTKAGTPTMGGALILVSICVTTLLWGDLSNKLLWVVLLVTLAFGSVGWIDDYRKVVHRNPKGLSAKAKFFWQSVIGLAAAAYLVYLAQTMPALNELIVPFFKHVAYPLVTIAVIVRQEIVLFIMGGVFVAETLSVMIQVLYFKWTGGKRIFRMAPLHHHYELEGWKESQVVVRFWIITMMLVLFGLSTLKLR